MAFQHLSKRWFWNWPTDDQGGNIQMEEKEDLPAIVQQRKELIEKEMNNPCRNPDYYFSDFDNIG